MRTDTPSSHSTRHPRREADPQSHGTPPESAGLPNECHPAVASIDGAGRDVTGAAHTYGRTFVSNRTFRRAGRAGVALAVGCAFAAVPLPAQAATPAVGLGTAE